MTMPERVIKEPEWVQMGDTSLLFHGEWWVSREAVRKLWQEWKQAWNTGDSEEAYVLMAMDYLLGVDSEGHPTV